MLVITSDLHLTDGTSGTTIKADAFEIFRERLKDLAYAASCRMYGSTQADKNASTYKPIDEIGVVLLGDVLDTIRTTRWLEEDVRPWDGPTHPKFAAKIGKITEAILENNRDLLNVFRDFKKNGVDIWGATAGQPDRTKKHNVRVRTYYVCGNHDWAYHVRGSEFNEIRKLVVDALGLANDPNQVFPHDTQELVELNKLCRDHHVFARHGDVFDSSNYEGRDRDRSSLGDAVVIELVDRFTHLVEEKLSTDAPEGLREIDNVRPLEEIPTWLNSLLRKNPTTAGKVREIWNNVVDDFLKLPFVRQHHSPLKWGLRLSEGMSFASLARIVPRAKQALTSISQTFPSLGKALTKIVSTDDFAPYASKERALEDAEISYIVYGHTHRHQIVPLKTAEPTAGKPKSVYLNSGTWRAVFEKASSTPKYSEFFGYHVMTYLSFFKDDERREREFETWSGSFESPMMKQHIAVQQAPPIMPRAA